MQSYDYLIAGAGLSGAVLAHEMVLRGKRVLVIDRRSHIGGNVYTENMGGLDVHKYGAHIFHTNDKEVWDYVRRFAEFNRFTNSPLANYKGEIYNLPFNMNTFHQMWGIVTPDEAINIINAQRGEIAGEPQNLEQQAISMVGRDIYVKLVKGYTEKQWGRDCKDLPAFIIRRLPLRFTYDNNYFSDRFQGIPIGGYTPIIQTLLEGAEVRLNADFKQIKREASYKKLIYTGAIDEYFDFCFGQLEYRSLKFETEDVEGISNYQGNAVVNYTDAQTPYTRIIEHKHFASHDAGQLKLNHTIITREYPQELRQGLEPFYPVNDERNQALYEKYKALAQGEANTIFAGRLGAYRYMNMDEAIRMALDLAKAEGA